MARHRAAGHRKRDHRHTGVEDCGKGTAVLGVDKEGRVSVLVRGLHSSAVGHIVAAGDSLLVDAEEERTLLDVEEGGCWHSWELGGRES
jgi:hypothetical protein